MNESITLMTLLLQAVKRVPVQAIFDRDRYESRREALTGSKLLSVLTVYPLIKSRFLRGLVRALEDHTPVQAAVGGPVARNRLSNALAHYPVELMVQAWMLILQSYSGWVQQLGKKFAGVALIDASLIKLSLAAYSWAEYRQQSGAAKMHAVLEWARGIPQQLILTPGKVHDAHRQAEMNWVAGWTYVQDRGYVCFRRLAQIMTAGAHFVVRLKRGMRWSLLDRRPVPSQAQPSGLRRRSDWTVRFTGWSDVLLRIVSYQLPDGRLVRLLTDRFDLSALSVAQLYTERWKIENWWKWIKARLKVKEPLGRSQNALQLQIVAAFVTDLLLRAFKHSSGFTGSLYEFVSRCQELSLVPLADLIDNPFDRALHAIAHRLNRVHLGPLVAQPP
jgi:hypothetical protein